MLYVLVLCFIACAGLTLIVLSQKKAIKSLTNQKKYIESKLAELRDSGNHYFVNPHFFFNQLNAIQSFASKLQPDGNFQNNLNLAFSKFGMLLRVLYDKNNFTSIAEEIRVVNYYLEYINLLYEFNIRIDIERSNNLNENAWIPKTLIQHFVENSIRHNSEEFLSGQPIIFISLIQTDKTICIEIKDNGQGFEFYNDLENKRIKEGGISHAQKAFAHINFRHHLNWMIDIQTKTGHGTKIKIQITENLQAYEQKQGYINS